MASKAKGRLPIVTVIHYDVGPDRSISVEEFLRSLKRVPHPSFSERRTQKRNPRSRTLESPARIPASTRNTPFLVGRDDTGISNPGDRVDEIEQPYDRNLTTNTTQDTTDLGCRSHALSAGIISLRSSTTCYGLTESAATPGYLNLAQPMSAESRPPKDIHAYPSRKRQSRQTPYREEPPPKQRKRRRRCASPSELPLIDTVEGTAWLNQTPNQQLQGQKPLSEIRDSIRLSKSRIVDPAEFKFPPVTPSNTRRATWKLGSGFKRQSRRQALGRSSPVRVRRKANLDTIAPPPVQGPSTASSISATHTREVPVIDSIAHEGLPQTPVTRKRTDEQRHIGRVSLPRAPHAIDSTKIKSLPLPTVLNPYKHRSNMSSPLKRGWSFTLTPRIDIKGDLEMGVSRRLKRMKTLPFIPPIKKKT